MEFRPGKPEAGHDLLWVTLGKLRDLSEAPRCHLESGSNIPWTSASRRQCQE